MFVYVASFSHIKVLVVKCMRGLMYFEETYYHSSQELNSYNIVFCCFSEEKRRIYSVNVLKI